MSYNHNNKNDDDDDGVILKASEQSNSWSSFRERLNAVLGPQQRLLIVPPHFLQTILLTLHCYSVQVLL